ncbi:hypothetical protein ABE527_18560 [Brucella sp. TWI432]
MPTIKLGAFTGEQPRLISRLLPATGAQFSVNTRLDDGGLTPFNSAVQVSEIASAASKTIHKFRNQWLSWPGTVHAAQGPVADERLYYTGDGKPKLRIANTVYDLAVARPTAAVTATLGGTGTGDVQTRIYTYTYVTDMGEESEPAPASAAIDWKPGQSVTLSGFQAPPAGRAITKQRIYRSQTGSTGTYFYFIAERAASGNNFVDNIAVDAFQEMLPSVAWNAPPDTLRGLIAMPNGMMAAFDGKKLYFCEPFRPHAWPEKYVLTTDSDIMGLGAVGTSLIIMTKAQPYLASGSSPETMQMVKLESNLPCINARGIVDLGFAIAYPSNEGLAAVTASGEARLVSGDIMSRDDWLAIDPATIIGGQLSGRYVAFYDTADANGTQMRGALFLDLGTTPYLIRTNTAVSAAYFEIETSALYFLAKGENDIYRMDAPTGDKESYYWKSKDFHTMMPLSYAAIQVDTIDFVSPLEYKNYEATRAQVIARNQQLIQSKISLGDLNAAPLNHVPSAGDNLLRLPTPPGNVRVGVYADDKLVATITRTGSAQRLPAVKATKWELDVSANVSVSQIVMSTTMDELRENV